MTVKIITPNGGEDALEFGCSRTLNVAAVTATEISSGESKLELKTTTSGAIATKLTVTGAGNVGIGEAAPARRLEVTETSSLNFTGVRTNNPNTNTGQTGIEFQSDPTYCKAAIYQKRHAANGVGNLYFLVDTNADASNWEASDEKLRIQSDGQAIFSGTVTASGSLVQGTASSSNRTFLRTAANWNYSQLDIKRNASNTANFKAISFQLDGDTDGDTNLYNYPNILINTDSAPTTGDTSVLENASLTINTPSTIRFGTNGAERMRIASDGAVTLGTPLPVGSGGTGTTGGSGWVKLATTGDITSGTSFTIDNCFSTTYHKYRFVYDVTNGGAASGSNYVAFRLRTGGASGADLTSTYHYRATRGYSGHANVEIASHDRNYVNDNYNRLDKGQHGVIDIFRSAVHNAPVFFNYESIGTHPGNDECFPTKIQGVNHTNNTTITGLKLYLYSGETSNAWTGRMTVYGAIR